MKEEKLILKLTNILNYFKMNSHLINLDSFITLAYSQSISYKSLNIQTIFSLLEFLILSQSKGDGNTEIKNLIQNNYEILNKEYSRIKRENADLQDIIEASLNHSIKISEQTKSYSDQKSTFKTLQKSSQVSQFCLSELGQKNCDISDFCW